MDRKCTFGWLCALVTASTLFAQGPRGSGRSTLPPKDETPSRSSTVPKKEPIALEKHRAAAEEILRPKKSGARLTVGTIPVEEGSDESLVGDVKHEQAAVYAEIKEFLKLVDDKVTAKVLINDGPELTLFRRLGALRGKGNSAILVETLRKQSKEPLTNAQVIFKLRELRIMMARYSTVLNAIPNDPMPYAEWSMSTLVEDSKARLKTNLVSDAHFEHARAAYNKVGGGVLVKNLEALAKAENGEFNSLVSDRITVLNAQLPTKEVAKK